jgi:hypothetical protein
MTGIIPAERDKKKTTDDLSCYFTSYTYSIYSRPISVKSTAGRPEYQREGVPVDDFTAHEI